MAHTKETSEKAVTNIITFLKQGEKRQSELLSLGHVDKFTLSYLLGRKVIIQRIDPSVRNAAGGIDNLYTLNSDWVSVVIRNQ